MKRPLVEKAKAGAGRAKNQGPARILIFMEGSEETFDVEISDGLFDAIELASLRLGIAPAEFVSEAMAHYLKRWRRHSANRPPSMGSFAPARQNAGQGKTTQQKEIP